MLATLGFYEMLAAQAYMNGHGLSKAFLVKSSQTWFLVDMFLVDMLVVPEYINRCELSYTFHAGIYEQTWFKPDLFLK
jgi:hypothetical protein